MKNLMILSIVCAMGLASCAKQTTCATYSKATNLKKVETHTKNQGNI
ncbi:MAG: hypothetical protein ACJ75J_00435 [Cytophagaceae bacterium]